MALKYNLAGGKPYNPYTLRQESVPAMRKEASRLRAVANKRISRIQAAGYRARATFAPISTLKTPEDVRGYLSDLYRFLTGPSTLKEFRAQRARAIADFIDAGFDFVDDTNLDALLKYLRIVREQVSYTTGSPIEIDYFERNYTGKETAEELAKGFYRWLDPNNKINIK